MSNMIIGGGYYVDPLYKSINYIQSTGTQYIDTGVIPNSTIEISAEFKTDSAITTSAMFFGGGSNYDSNNIELYGNSYGGFEYHYNGYYQSNVSIGTSKFLYTQKQNKCEVYINGSLVDTYTFATSTFTAPYTLYIFALHRSSIIITSQPIKCCSFKMNKDGILVRDFIPKIRRSDEAIGLLDRANDVFYGNAGTGTFLYG